MQVRHIKVLLIDDDEDDFLFTRELLAEARDQRFSLDWVDTCERALEVISRREHDAYLLDYRLGGRDGLELLRQAIRDGCTAPIILLTGQGDHQTDMEALKAGAADYLAKDQITAEVLTRSIRYALERKEAQESLRQSEEKYRLIFETAANLILSVNGEGVIVDCNKQVQAMLGYRREELLGRPISKIYHPNCLEKARKSIQELVEHGGDVCRLDNELQMVRKDGQIIDVSVNASGLRDRNGRFLLAICIVTDITQRKRAQSQLLHKALHDPLTGLPNRALFMDRLLRQMRRAKRRRGYRFAVLFVDLDRFKIINDSLGHLTGDRFLSAIARRLKGCLRPVDTVARLGGDEFGIILEGVRDGREAEMVAERIKEHLSVPFNLDGHEVLTTASIGIAINDRHYEGPDELMRDADVAMYHAKSQGRARHAVFSEPMRNQAAEQFVLETDLRRAVENGGLCLHYQPIFCVRTGRIAAMEALLRWRHPTRGLLNPSQFLPLAEESGLIVPIGRWAIRQACGQMRRWHEQFPSESDLAVSVNMSARQFVQGDLVNQVRQALDVTGLDPRKLNLEITENLIMEHTETISRLLSDLKALKVQVHMDDFGTGYSSLSYLHRFPIDALKIDRSFVSQMITTRENYEIVRTIVKLAKILKMEVIAEGVETEEQLAQLEQMGCTYVQGFYLAKPADVEGATRLIAEQAANSGSESAMLTAELGQPA